MLGKGIVIAGVGETEQGKLEGRGSFQLLAEVTKITLDDAGVTLGEVDGMVTAFSFVELTRCTRRPSPTTSAWSPATSPRSPSAARPPR